MADKLFEPGGYFAGSKKTTGMVFTEAARLRNTLNEQKTEVLTDDEITIDLDRSVLQHDGQTYLLPDDFTQAIKDGTLQRKSAVPQDPLKYIDGPLEAKILNWDRATEPMYYLHIPGNPKSYEVYGYGADYGKGFHVSPIVTEVTGWEDSTWLCRCAQCGRELPPSYYYINTSGRPRAICKGCTSINNLVDTIFAREVIYRTREDQKLLANTRHWYEGLWKRNFCPRGKYAEHCLGADEIKARMRKATKHRRGSTPRPPKISKAARDRANALIDEIKGVHGDSQVI